MNARDAARALVAQAWETVDLDDFERTRFVACCVVCGGPEHTIAELYAADPHPLIATMRTLHERPVVTTGHITA